MKLLLRLLFLLTALTLVAVTPAPGTETPPDALVKNTTEEVLAILRQDSGVKQNRKKLLALIDAKVLPHFDFTRMTRLAVGKHWKRATPQQQQTLVTEFRTLLVRTYSNALSNYKNQKVEFVPLRAQAGDTDVTVRTKAVQPGGKPVPIDYAMERTPAGWKVYDVAVDNVSLVKNYRSSFASEVQQGGIDKLVSSLQQKNQSLESGGPPREPGKP